ncbi:MAG: hypothetical protein HY559_02860 [Gammaproteobacteria bacterium]|nr:hypothetical protein [Gammaproteobacteria bacterium]
MTSILDNYILSSIPDTQIKLMRDGGPKSVSLTLAREGKRLAVADVILAMYHDDL